MTNRAKGLMHRGQTWHALFLSSDILLFEISHLARIIVLISNL
jgi:hypothetical protein